MRQRGRKPQKPQPHKDIHYHTTIYAKSKKKGVPQRRTGSGNLRLWTGARKVENKTLVLPDTRRAPDLLKQKKTK